MYSLIAPLFGFKYVRTRLVGWFFVVEYAEFFFAFRIVENFVSLEFVLGFLDYAVVFFCAEPRFFNDEIRNCSVVDSYLLEVGVS